MRSLLWNEPRSPLRAAVVLLHGFARGPQRLSGLASVLAGVGALVARPTIPSWTPWNSLHDESYLHHLGQEVARAMSERAPDVPLIGIGHSAGAAVVSGWMRQGLDGVILLDPVDRHRRIAGLVDACTPSAIRVITADPSSCNRHGAATRRLASAGLVLADASWRRITNTAHPDPERIPGTLEPGDVRPSDAIARWACGRGGSAEAVCEWGRSTVEFVTELVELAR